MPGGAPRLVLVGAGHAHAVALRRWWREGGPDVDLVLITDRPDTVYSGMVPGWIAGEYRRGEVVMDARLMAERAGGQLLLARAVAVDPDDRRIELDDGSALPYDLASLDVGSVVHVPGDGDVDALVSARRPDAIVDVLGRVVDIGGTEARAAAVGRRAAAVGGRVAVVGGGAAGVELAACVQGQRAGQVTLLEAGDRLMAGHDPSVSRRAAAALERRGVVVRCGSAVVRCGPTAGPRDSSATTGDPPDAAALELELSDAETLTVDAAIWATGPAPPPLLAASDLPTDEAGFVRIRKELRVVGHDDLFAAGDCASFEPDAIPRAGVHAVRQGEVLYENLVAAAAALRRGPRGPNDTEGADAARPPHGSFADLRSYEPQSDYLTLLNLGDGTALGTKWGYVSEGRWVRWLKDRIDRRFVESFQG